VVGLLFSLSTLAGDTIIFDDSTIDTTATFPAYVYDGGGDEMPTWDMHFPLFGAPEGEYVARFHFNRRGGWSGGGFQSLQDTLWTDSLIVNRHELDMTQVGYVLQFWVFSEKGGKYRVECGDYFLGIPDQPDGSRYLPVDKSVLVVFKDFVPNTWVYEQVDWEPLLDDPDYYSPYHRPYDVLKFDPSRVGQPFLVADPGGMAARIGEFDVFFDEIKYTSGNSVKDNVHQHNPQGYRLSQNYPNPFNSGTTIKYHLPKAGKVSVEVYDISGQEIRVLVDGENTAGEHQVIWDGRDRYGNQVPSGLYLYQLRLGSYCEVKKMLLIK